MRRPMIPRGATRDALAVDQATADVSFEEAQRFLSRRSLEFRVTTGIVAVSAYEIRVDHGHLDVSLTLDGRESE